MAILELCDFNYRRVIKIAPDAFITVNGAFGGRVISPTAKEGTQDIDLQGGITSISVSSAVSPAGAGKATIQITAPDYAGLHTKSTSSSCGYWVTLPSGAKIPYFLPMMELQVFMKGRFLNGTKKEPTYYRTFWGFITDITEDFSDGTNRLTLQCNDMLNWWKYQKIAVSPNEMSTSMGGPPVTPMSTIFKNKNPWQIIIQLLYETQWQSAKGESTYAFAITKYSNVFQKPIFGNFPVNAISTLAIKMNEYWNKRFNFFGEAMAIEMFGLTKKVASNAEGRSFSQGPIDPQHGSVDANQSTILRSQVLGEEGVVEQVYSEIMDADVSIDHNLLARVKPFGEWDLFAVGGQSLEMSKLEIAQKVCESTHMEFFVDMNGIVVFKPPFYNMDVTKGDVEYYVIKTNEIISNSATINTDHICNYLEVTAPTLQYSTNLIEIAGVHIDWESMLRYGLRHQRAWVSYGNDHKSLSLIAAAEMARINAEANTGHVTIPLRPEIRLGYPVYLANKDVYYYVSGITHSFSFGGSATTDLSLVAKRERIYDVTGEFTKDLPSSDTRPEGVVQAVDAPVSGRVMKGFVQKFIERAPGRNPDRLEADEQLLQDIGGMSSKGSSADEQALRAAFTGRTKTAQDQDDFLRAVGARAGSKTNGVYKIVPGELTVNLNTTAQNTGISNATGNVSTVMSNQILMITDDTVPYTDIRGYRHIGAFPYGANLIIRHNGVKTTGEINDYNDGVTSTSIENQGGGQVNAAQPPATGDTDPRPAEQPNDANKVTAEMLGTSDVTKLEGTSFDIRKSREYLLLGYKQLGQKISGKWNKFLSTSNWWRD